MELVVGTDSTWSLRAWICGQLARIDFSINVIDFTHPDFKEKILQHSPSGLVPALIDKSLVVHDSLAITEYINEYSQGALFPTCKNNRALSRSLCAELHAGFFSLRSQCPFTLDEVVPRAVLSPAIKKELSRLEQIFEQAQLPFMFESAGAVDAFYAILAYRLQTYGVMLTGQAGEYQKSLLDWSHLQGAIKQAQQWSEE